MASRHALMAHWTNSLLVVTLRCRDRACIAVGLSVQPASQVYEFTSVQFSHSVVFNSLQPYGFQNARIPCPSPTLRACSNLCLSSQWCHPPTHLILCLPFVLLPSIFPSIRVFSIESLLCIRWPKYWRFLLQHQFFQCIFRTDFL